MKEKIIVSVITTLLSLPLFMVTPLAEPKNVYNTPYGTYTTDYQLVNSDQYGEIQIGPFVIYAVDKNISTFKYQFNNYYTGTVTINTFTNINPTDSLASYKPEMFTDNCTILSYTDSSVTFYIKNVKEFSATIVYPTGNSQFNIQAWANPGTTNITVQTDTQSAVNQILSYVQFINEDSFSIAADMTTVKNKLLDSLGYGTSDDTIETDFDTLISAVNSVGTKIDVLHTDLTNINNSINNINNIKWTSYNDVSYTVYDDTWNEITTFPYTYNHINVMVNNIYSISVQEPRIPRLYKFNIPVYTTNYRYDPITVSVGYLYGSNLIENDSYVYFVENNTYYTTVYFWGNIPSNSQIIFTFNNKANGNNMRYSGSTSYISAEYINNTDIQYWQLLDIFKEQMNNNSILDAINAATSAINNMSLNVNQLTVNATGITYNTNETQVNNSVTNYNTNINQVYNVENNISSDFDTYNQQFTPDFTTSLTALQDTSTMMNGIITQINSIQLFTVPILLTLVGIVLLAILG